MESKRVAILSAALTAAFFLGLAALAAGPLRNGHAAPTPAPVVVRVTPAPAAAPAATPLTESEALRRRLKESHAALATAYAQIERLQAAQAPPPAAGRRHHDDDRDEREEEHEHED